MFGKGQNLWWPTLIAAAITTVRNSILSLYHLHYHHHLRHHHHQTHILTYSKNSNKRHLKQNDWYNQICNKMDVGSGVFTARMYDNIAVVWGECLYREHYRTLCWWSLFCKSFYKSCGDKVFFDKLCW